MTRKKTERKEEEKRKKKVNIEKRFSRLPIDLIRCVS